MLLCVADTPDQVEETRRMFESAFLFTYCAVKENMLSLAEKYKPAIVLLRVKEFTDGLKADVLRLCEILPSVRLITVTDDETHGLPIRFHMPANASDSFIFFEAVHYMPRLPASAIADYDLLVDGMYFGTYSQTILIFGVTAHDITSKDAFVLRLLAFRYPEYTTAEEIAACCFGYGKVASANAVRARIARINRHAMSVYNKHKVIKYAPGRGYHICF